MTAVERRKSFVEGATEFLVALLEQLVGTEKPVMGASLARLCDARQLVQSALAEAFEENLMHLLELAPISLRHVLHGFPKCRGQSAVTTENVTGPRKSGSDWRCGRGLDCPGTIG
jgi:hypothetical protein